MARAKNSHDPVRLGMFAYYLANGNGVMKSALLAKYSKSWVKSFAYQTIKTPEFKALMDIEFDKIKQDLIHVNRDYLIKKMESIIVDTTSSKRDIMLATQILSKIAGYDQQTFKIESTTPLFVIAKDSGEEPSKSS